MLSASPVNVSTGTAAMTKTRRSPGCRVKPRIFPAAEIRGSAHANPLSCGQCRKRDLAEPRGSVGDGGDCDALNPIGHSEATLLRDSNVLLSSSHLGARPERMSRRPQGSTKSLHHLSATDPAVLDLRLRRQFRPQFRSLCRIGPGPQCRLRQLSSPLGWIRNLSAPERSPWDRGHFYLD